MRTIPEKQERELKIAIHIQLLKDLHHKLTENSDGSILQQIEVQ